ncbi:MAG: cobalamin-dependent protein [Gammaproteobacteria bacterium]|jgi:methanogenic corrinoid protein MtbC1
MSANAAIAELLQADARDIASLACADLLATHPDIDKRFGKDAEELWSDHLYQRLLELATALLAGNTGVFVSGLAWSRSALQARGLTSEDVDNSLSALRSAIVIHCEDEESKAALDYIDQAAAALAKGVPANMDSLLDPGVPSDRLALQYVQTVVAGNVQPGIQLVLDAVAHGMSIADAYLRVLLAAQSEVGRLWHLNQLSVSEEHLVSYTTQRLMAMLSGVADKKSDNGYTAVAGAVAGNVHDIGIRAISYLLEIEGWRTIYLGSDIPQIELPNTLATYKADVLLLSVALTSQVAATTSTIAAIREHCETPVKILVGGNGLANDRDLWREIGADGYAADAETALTLAYELAAKNQNQTLTQLG